MDGLAVSLVCVIQDVLSQKACIIDADIVAKEIRSRTRWWQFILKSQFKNSRPPATAACVESVRMYAAFIFWSQHGSKIQFSSIVHHHISPPPP